MATLHPAQHLGRKICETAHLVFAGLWLGSLVMSGATAGILFTTMRTLEPSFGKFAAYAGPQSDLGAGFIQNRVFLFGDMIQFACASGVLASLVAMIAVFGLPLRRISTGLRVAAVGAAMLLVSYNLLVLAPRMQQNAAEYWSAAEQGAMDRAAVYYDAFQADHPTARNVLGGTALAVALVLAAGAWSAASAGAAVGPGKPKRVEEPLLARNPVRGSA